MSEIHFIIKP